MAKRHGGLEPGSTGRGITTLPVLPGERSHERLLARIKNMTADEFRTFKDQPGRQAEINTALAWAHKKKGTQ